MAKFNKDSVSGTISVVVLLSLVCSVIVAGSAVLLKSTQEEQKALDKQKNILSVSGLLKKGSNIQEIYAKNIEPKFVDLNTVPPFSFIRKCCRYRIRCHKQHTESETA